MSKSEDARMQILKEEIKKYIRKVLEQMSTGTGATMSPGAGETYATPNAFVGGSPKNTKKKKKYTITKKLGTK